MPIDADLRAKLERIDAAKDRIRSHPVPPEYILKKLEKEFIVETVYHANRIEGSLLTREETELALSTPESRP